MPDIESLEESRTKAWIKAHRKAMKGEARQLQLALEARKAWNALAVAVDGMEDVKEPAEEAAKP